MNGTHSLTTLLHIGFQKSGSSYLQNRIFNNAAAGFQVPLDNSRLILHDQLILTDPYAFSAASAQASFAPACRRVISRSLVPVLSDENLIGHPYYAFASGPFVANRLKAVFPDARILICIREQQSTLYSYYCQSLKECQTHTLDDYLGHRRMPSGAVQRFRWDLLYYDRVIAHYQQLFGPDRVLVLPFELMTTDLDVFISRIIDFAGASPEPGFTPPAVVVNPRLGGATIKFRRWLNHFVPAPDYTRESLRLRFRLVTKSVGVVDRALPPALNNYWDRRNRWLIRERLSDFYRRSNQQTSRLINLDLAEFGYDC